MKMQHVKFNSVDECLDFLPEDELQLTLQLRAVIVNCIPDIKERLAYNVPYYKRHKNICFIWPASVLWGQQKTYTGVRLGFTAGHLLPDTNNYLKKDNRKYVYWRDYTHLTFADIEMIRALLFEAVEIDMRTIKQL